MIKHQGFGRNMPTATEFKAGSDLDFDREQSKLIEQIRMMGEKGAAAIANKKHPFFGLISDQEWGNLMYIHLDHHLKQFGL